MELLGDVGHVEPQFGLFGDNVSVGARLVHSFTEQTIGSKIILDEHDVTARCMGHVESRFSPFGDCVNIEPFGDTR
jgi:hypothetical protein